MDDAEVIIKVNDTQLLKKDVMQYYDNYKATLQYQYQMYSAFGYQVTMPSDDEIKQIVVDALVLQEVRKQKAAELGLDQLTADDEATIQENAQSSYDSAYAQVKTNVTTDGMSDDEITAAADKYMADNDITLDKYVEDARKQHILTISSTSTFTRISTVTDDEVQAEFDSRVAADQAGSR